MFIPDALPTGKGMARRLRDSRIDTRAARLKLRQQPEPYWRLIAEGQHLGYYRGKTGGTWVVRWRPSADDVEGTGADRRYHKGALGEADDFLDADGARILSFAQAQDAARTWCQQRLREVTGQETRVGAYTVDDALDDYLAWMGEVHRKSIDSTRYRLEAQIRPKLGRLRADRLTTKILRSWHAGIANEQPRVRSKKGSAQRFRAITGDEIEARRRRQSSANRVLTILKAALNRAFEDGKVASDAAWRKVKPFKGVDLPRIRYLTDAEAVRLVNACGEAFRPMVRAALLTGCRYGELCRLRVADFDALSGLLTITSAKGGKPRHVFLTQEGVDFFSQQAAGKAGDALMLPRPDGGRWSHSHQQRPVRDACTAAKINPPVSFHILRHTYGSRLTMRGVPLNVTGANLGHADMRMTQRHYAHLAPSYIADVIRGAAPALGIVPPAGNVVELKQA